MGKVEQSWDAVGVVGVVGPEQSQDALGRATDVLDF